jgi:hypothetical protein
MHGATSCRPSAFTERGTELGIRDTRACVLDFVGDAARVFYLVGAYVVWRKIKRLRQMWDAGIASGSTGALDMKKLRREPRERLKGAARAAGNAD